LGLALDESNENEDTTLINSIDVLLSDDVKTIVERNIIDYVKSPYGEGFTITPEGNTYC